MLVSYSFIVKTGIWHQSFVLFFQCHNQLQYFSFSLWELIKNINRQKLKKVNKGQKWPKMAEKDQKGPKGTKNTINDKIGPKLTEKDLKRA